MEKPFLLFITFFRDERYIKIDGRPVFMIYIASLMPCLANMIDCWKELAAQENLPEIFFIGNECRIGEMNGLDAEFVYEPRETLQYVKRDELGRGDYDELWGKILAEKQKKTDL